MDMSKRLSLIIAILIFAVFMTPSAGFVSLAATQCSDGIDNDGDTFIDLADSNCVDAADNSEAPPPPPAACADGIDNDGDGRTDHPSDPGCSSSGDGSEYSPGLADFSITTDNNYAEEPGIYTIDFRLADKSLNAGDKITVNFPAGAGQYFLGEYDNNDPSNTTNPSFLKDDDALIPPGTIEFTLSSGISDGSNVRLQLDLILNPETAGSYTITVDATGFPGQNGSVAIIDPPPPPPPGSGSTEPWDIDYTMEDCRWSAIGSCFKNAIHIIIWGIPKGLIRLVAFVLSLFLDTISRILLFIASKLLEIAIWTNFRI